MNIVDAVMFPEGILLVEPKVVHKPSPLGEEIERDVVSFMEEAHFENITDIPRIDKEARINHEEYMDEVPEVARLVQAGW
jgi:hypothetical protein